MSSVRVFISHSERDAELVGPMYDWLKCGLGLGDHEIRCTSIDKDAGGNNVAVESLRNDLEAADAVVGLLTSNSLRSHWVGMEMGASWLKKCLCLIRGPGMMPRDLPAPLPAFTAVGYCEKQAMRGLLQKLASRMQKPMNEQAEFDLDSMVSTAEQFMRRQVRGWFELPPLLSAWRLRDVDFVAPLFATLKVLHIEAEDQEEVQECAEPTGLIARDPDSLPAWATDHWNLSKLTVNHLLTGRGEFVRIPYNILSEELTAELRRAWGSAGPRRGQMLHDWMQKASSHVVDNLSLETRGH
jgi:TIR domain